jgi:hypothetical protein
MTGLLIFWSFMAYGMTTILVYGSIFENQREWIGRKSKFFGELINCPLCTSTWVGFFLSAVLGSISAELFAIGYFGIFFDGLFTAGIVWTINSIVEFFEESRIK